MARPKLKLGVTPAQYRDWLKRFEEGQSPPQIARAVGYDVRTVRRHLEVAQQEREAREARAAVLRQALERHYADLVAFAAKLEQQVTAPVGIRLSAKVDRLWGALRQHLPSSVLWKQIERWEDLQRERDNLRRQVTSKATAAVQARRDFRLHPRGGPEGLYIDGLVDALVLRVEALAERGDAPSFAVLVERVEHNGKRRARLVCHARICGTVPRGKASLARRQIEALLAEVEGWSEIPQLREKSVAARQLTGEIGEELATILLRRVVPGRCKYCPV